MMQLLSALLLLCAFALLAQRRLAAMITLYQIEAWALAAAAFVQGFAQGSDALYLTGIITLAIKGFLFPLLLRRINAVRAVEALMPAGMSMVIGAALTGIAVMAMLPGSAAAFTPMREDLAIALSILLLGLLMLVTRRNAVSQAIGFLSAENGLMLAAILMPGMPFLPEISVALLALSGMLIGGVSFFQRRADLDHVEEFERQRR